MGENKTLNLNRVVINGLARMRFSRMDEEKNGENIFRIFSQMVEPKLIYNIVTDFSKVKADLSVSGVNFYSKDIKDIADEIVSGVIFYAITLGDIEKIKAKANGIFEETLVDIIGTCYVDAIRDFFRSALEDDMLIGANFVPGISLDIEDIDKIDRVLNLSSIGISQNEYRVMLPEKSVCGFYLTYEENHPEKRGDCSTCMARGFGCNLCYEGDDDV